MKKMIEIANSLDRNVREFRDHQDAMNEIYESLVRLKDLED